MLYWLNSWCSAERLQSLQNTDIRLLSLSLTLWPHPTSSVQSSPAACTTASHFQYCRPCVEMHSRCCSASCICPWKNFVVAHLRSAPTGCVQLPMEQTSVRQRSFVFHRPTVWNSLSSVVSLPTARFSKTVENVFIRTMKRHRAAFCAWLWHRESEKSLNSVHVNWTHSHYTTDKRADACTVCEQTDRFEKLWTDLVWNSSRQAVAYRRTDPYIMHGTD